MRLAQAEQLNSVSSGQLLLHLVAPHSDNDADGIEPDFT